MLFPHWRDAGALIRVDEFREDGTLVVSADLPGIDQDKDVAVTVSDGMLHIDAERRAEEEQKEKGYVRHEVQYGFPSRSLPLPLPTGVTEADITAAYRDGVLEVRVQVRRARRARRQPSAGPEQTAGTCRGAAWA